MNEAEPQMQLPARLRRASLVGVLLACAHAPLGSTLASVGLPDLSHSLTVELAAATTWIVTSYLIVNIVAQSPGGKLGDLLGATRALRIGMLLQAAGAALGVLAGKLGWLVAARVGMAFGGALVIPAAVALLRQRTPAAEHGRMFGLVAATMGMAGAVGPALGGELVAHIGWRAMFAAPLALTLCAGALIALAGLPEETRDSSRDVRGLLRDFDSLGTLLLAVWLSALFAFSRAQTSLVLGVFAVAIIGFVARELRATQPVFDLGLFRQGGFGAGGTLIGLQNYSFYGVLFLLPGYFEHVRHVNPAEVGRALFAMMFCMFVAAPLGGRLCDRWGPRASAGIAVVPLLAGLWLLQEVPRFERPAQAVLGLCCLGAAVGLSNAPSMSAAMSGMPHHASASGAGAISTLRYLGGVFSILTLSLSAQAGTLATEYALRAFGIAGVLAAGLVVLMPARIHPHA